MLANSSALPARPSGMFSARRPGIFLGADAGALRRLHMLVRLDEADQQRIDQDVERRALARQHLGQRHAGGAREIVVGALSGTRRLRADVEHVDDAAPAPLLHLRPDQAREPHGREQLLVEVVMQDLVGQRLERHRPARCRHC